MALSALLFLTAAQNDPTVQVNGGGVNPSTANPSVRPLEPLVLDSLLPGMPVVPGLKIDAYVVSSLVCLRAELTRHG